LATVAILWKSSKELLSFDGNFCIFKDLEKGITKPLGEFMKRNKGFEA